MERRYVSIWFRYLRTDWVTRRQPVLKNVPFVLTSQDHNRIVISAVNAFAEAQGIFTGMVAADARAIFPSLILQNDKPEVTEKLLRALGEWCIRFSPIVGVDLPDGLILDASGCPHLWGGEQAYLRHIFSKLKALDYTVRIAMAGTRGTAWAVARYGKGSCIVESGKEYEALVSLPPAAFRLEGGIIERLEKLGLHTIGDFISIPRTALRRRFGEQILARMDEALGNKEEVIEPVVPVEPYQERLPSLEPIRTATGIEIALQKLLDALCKRLQKDSKGLRKAVFKCYRIDGKLETVEIGTNHASHNPAHLFKLFQLKTDSIEPALGIELFTIEAHKVEDVSLVQIKLWDAGGVNTGVAELLDRIAGKLGTNCFQRFLPDEHYWPERSFKPASSLQEERDTSWKVDRPRPLNILPKPEPIHVMAPIPDYPPMSFRYRGKLHKVKKAEGPERIEQEWWIEDGQHRDYYAVEDEEGHRYWLFRLGHYDVAKTYGWYIHGFFE